MFASFIYGYVEKQSVLSRKPYDGPFGEQYYEPLPARVADLNTFQEMEGEEKDTSLFHNFSDIKGNDPEKR